MEKRVYVKPLRKNAWAGVNKYPNCFDDLAPYYTISGGIYTGLDSKKEKELNKTQVYRGVDLAPTSDFWSTYYIRIGDNGLVLDLGRPDDLLRYYFLKGHKDIKSSSSDNKPSAKYMLVDELEEAKKQNVAAEKKVMAMKEYASMTPTEKRAALRLYNINSEDISPELVDSQLFSRIDRYPEKFIKKWVENEHRETEVILLRSIAAGIVKKRGGSHWLGDPKTGELLGRSFEDAVLFLEDKKNQETRLVIKKQLKEEK